MKSLQDKARALLEAGDVQVVIGYADGSDKERARPLFARNAEQAGQLIHDARCRQNLAAYLMKPDVKTLGRVALVCLPGTLRTLLQYAVENQLTDGAVLALTVSDDGAVSELADFAAIEEYVASLPSGLSAEQQAELDRIDNMSSKERWDFWSAEMSRCLKCYACRAACPLCYCTRCITDVNQPQWVPVASDPLGNLEWNVVRAMHLAGRCVACGACADACPAGIRIDLLNQVLGREARTQFGATAGLSVRKDYALSAFKPDDKEEFIR